MPKQFYKNALVNNSRTYRQKTPEQTSYHCVIALCRTPMRFIGMIAYLHYCKKYYLLIVLISILIKAGLPPIQLWEKISSLADR
jgi:hypothetical protein